jgi:non-specific protein-tyrosine kinase
LQSGQRLATTYQQLVVTEPVLAPVAQQLGEGYTVKLLQTKVSAATVRDTQLLKISVSDSDPARAADIANAVAAQFASFISEQELASTSTSQAGLQKLIDDTQTQVDQTRQSIGELEAIESLDASQQAELDGLRTRLSQLENSLASLLVQQQNLNLNSSSLQNQVRVYVPATVPTEPYAPRMLFYAVLGAFLGLILAVGAVGVLEYLDNTVKPTLDFQELFGAPMLSVVQSIPKLAPGSDQLFVLTHAQSNSAESIRLLRTNIEFAAATREITLLTISSAAPGEGKSTVTANLAVTMSQAGFSVIVIDADLRRPSQHKIFQIGNHTGLTTLLTHPLMPWGTAAVDIMSGLKVIPSGPLPPNPSDLLSGDRFKELLENMRHSADIVILDTPPVLAVSDPLVVSTSTDALLLVSHAQRTRIDALAKAMADFPESVRRIGVVLNQQPVKRNKGYYYYGYYGTYGPDDQDPGSTRLNNPDRVARRRPRGPVPSTSAAGSED